VSARVELGDGRNGWLELAACRGSPTWLWFSARPVDRARTVAVCASCRVRGECLADALELEADGYRFGGRGGRTANERAAMSG
jgi:Transcription factor WhiB